MQRRKLLPALLLTVLICCGIAHSATLTPDAMVQPAPQPQTAQGTEGLQELSKLKTSTNPGWVSRCMSETRKSPVVCSVEETLVLANTGQVVATVAVRTQSDTKEPMMTVRVPVGIYLPGGLSMQIDEGKPQALPLQTCNLQGCYAEIPISQTLLASLEIGPPALPKVFIAAGMLERS